MLQSYISLVNFPILGSILTWGLHCFILQINWHKILKY
jgi:hypothetical protein